MCVNDAEQRAVVKQKGNGEHLHGGLELAKHVHSHTFGGADLGHPFAQGRNRYFTPDDDERHKHIGSLQVHQDQQGGTN